MSNSLGICRKHYAALIPEKMRDVVEFDQPENAGSELPGDGTKAMLKQIREKLQEGKVPSHLISRLRVMRRSESA